MLNDKYRALVDSLLEKTRRGELEWQQASVSGAIQLNFKSSSLTLREEEESSGGLDYIIDIYNDYGQIVETFSDVDIKEEIVYPNDYSWYKKMRDLFQEGRRRALGADVILNSIMNELKQR